MESGVLYVRNLANTDWVVAIGGVGNQGTQGYQGPSGSPGTPGGPQGYQGYQGTGTRGYQGYQGYQGERGYQGYQGRTGVGFQGYQGITGSQGFQGVQGEKGNQGYQGQSGTAGFQGYQGYQGLEGTPGGPQGYQGNQGVPGSGSGGGHIIEDEGSPMTQRAKLDFQGQNVWVFDDLANNATEVVISGGGATGPQGYQGVTGSQGFQGYQGHTGIGFQGYQGYTGAQGAQGYQGTTGSQGSQGYQGVTGTQGTQGYQGATGSQGFQGFQGYQGHTGVGFQGYQGYSGAQGPQGNQGLAGSGAAHTIRDEVTPLTQRTYLSFKGENVWAIDNVGSDSTDVIISGSASSPALISGTPQYIARFNNTGNQLEPFLYTSGSDIHFSDGRLYFGTGSDINLFRYQNDLLMTDDNLFVMGYITTSDSIYICHIGDKLYFGDNSGTYDVDLYRTADGHLITDNRMAGQPAINPDEFMTLAQYTGSQGAQGYQGYQGNTGSQGFQGYQGYTGTQGFQGYQGHTGSTGAQGYQGNTGSQGFQGYQGYQGVPGSGGVITGTIDYIPKYNAGSGLSPSTIHQMTEGLDIVFDNGVDINGTTYLLGELYVDQDVRISGGIAIGSYPTFNPPTRDLYIKSSTSAIYLGTGSDVNLYRGATNILKSDDNLDVVGGVRIGSGLYVGNVAGSPTVDNVIADGTIYGKNALVAGFSTGTPSAGDIWSSGNIFLRNDASRIYLGQHGDAWLERGRTGSFNSLFEIHTSGGFSASYFRAVGVPWNIIYFGTGANPNIQGDSDSITFTVTDRVFIGGNLEVQDNLIVKQCIVRNATGVSTAGYYTGTIFVPMWKPAGSSAWNGDVYNTTTGNMQLNMSTVFTGIPALDIQAYLLQVSIRDAGGRADADSLLGFVGDHYSTDYVAIRPGYSQARYTTQELIVPADDNGDIWYKVQSISGSSIWLTVMGFFL